MQIRKLFLFIAIAAIIGAVSGCSSKPEVTKEEVLNENTAPKVQRAVTETQGGGPSMPAIIQIAPQELDAMKGAADVVLLDVREPAELTGELPAINGAVNIPLGSLGKRMGELDKSKKIVVICRSGGRSSVAAQLLIRNGFTQVYNLNGGMLAYTKK